ncbi:unnamed protein product [Tuwongella immobilis]|uniref:Uncharacterized protein n=1 Tax=Tuwongella immobilis TaxID=692036 RepID=A0A6C2YUL1_9BACT|nr:unnamed protein product [Tuwongella immobilis]VTS06817.1 unnamed protein product [Tuwongella immobilis]
MPNVPAKPTMLLDVVRKSVDFRRAQSFAADIFGENDRNQ